MIRWLSLIALSLSTATCSPAYASPFVTPIVSYENVTRSLIETPDASQECLALNLFFEVRDEPIDSWLAVAFVTINRVIDPRFPNTICGVVWEPKQFSWTHDGKSDTPDVSSYLDRKAWRYIQQFTKGFLENYRHIEDPTNGSLYYHAHYVEPKWRESFRVAGEIGGHVFYVNDGLHR